MKTSNYAISQWDHEERQRLDKKLAAYFASAGFVGATIISSDANAFPVGNNTEVPIGINSEINIDFNGDSLTDLQIDHDRYDDPNSALELDYLQIDKNDTSSAADPLPTGAPLHTPFPGISAGDGFNVGYLTIGVTPFPNNNGSYPAALTAGTSIGPADNFDFQEGNNFDGAGTTIRANRLIDEDAGTIDQVLGGLLPAQLQPAFNGPNFLGLGGNVRYLGLEMVLEPTDTLHYGWIGIRIDNEADATGAVVGFGYNDAPGHSILAGQTVPEPGTMVLAALGGVTLAGSWIVRRMRRK